MASRFAPVNHGVAAQRSERQARPRTRVEFRTSHERVPLAAHFPAKRLRGLMVRTALLSVYLTLLVIAARMLWFDTFFQTFYASGVPWAHTTLAFVLLILAMAGFARQAARVRWRSILRKHLFKAAAFAAVLVAVAYAGHRLRPLPAVPGATRSAILYLDDALWHLERYYLRRDEIEWPAVRRAAFDRAVGAKTPEDTFPAIVAALTAVGDPHNSLLTRGWRRQFRPINPGVRSQWRPRSHFTSDHVAYVSVPSFVGSGMGSLYFLDDENGRSYARDLRQTLRRLDEQSPIGWIVDLRRNPGGNMWPMLDGLAGLIGEGCIAAIDMPQFDRRVDTWIVNGRASSGAPWFAGLMPWEHPLLLRHGSAPVVVLVGRMTASSGEAVVVALRGRPRTRLIGAPTAGVPTALQGVSLGAGAELMITIGRQVDRTGRAYDGRIIPDESIPETETTALLAAASKWIHAQEARTFGNAPPNFASRRQPLRECSERYTPSLAFARQAVAR